MFVNVVFPPIVLVSAGEEILRSVGTGMSQPICQSESDECSAKMKHGQPAFAS